MAHLARLCVPIDDDFDQARLGWRPTGRPARLRLVADADGLDRDGRVELLSAMNDAIARIEAAVRRSVAAGKPVSVELWNRTGGSERYDRRRRWWTDHYDQVAAVLTYSAFVAVFPLLLLFVTILGFVLGSSKDADDGVLRSALVEFSHPGRPNSSVRFGPCGAAASLALSAWRDLPGVASVPPV